MIAIHPSTEQDHADIVAIENAINPDRIAHTIERFRAAIRTQPPEAQAQSYVAEIDGQVAGHLWLNRLLYVPDPDVWYTELSVYPELQGRGVGSRLYEFLLERLADHRARRVHAHVREDLPAARTFAADRGFRETKHGARYARLDVREANLESCLPAAERVRREGIRIATLQELDGDEMEMLRRIHELIKETGADMPSAAGFTYIPFDEWLRQRAEEGERSDMVWVALDGSRVVGVSVLWPRGEHAAFSGHTGVARSHRARGIGRALKHDAVEWARRHGVSSLYTETDVENAPMRRINTEIGYRPLPTSLEIVKDVGGTGDFPWAGGSSGAIGTT